MTTEEDHVLGSVKTNWTQRLLLHVVKLLLKLFYIIISSSIDLFLETFVIIELNIDFVSNSLPAFDTFLDNVSTRVTRDHVSAGQKLYIGFII